MGKVSPAREAAFASLNKMKYGRYSNLEVNATLGHTRLGEEDRRLYTALVYGVTERLITLDYIISKYSNIPVANLDGETLCALRLGIYQLCYMDRVPDHAAVSESVSLAGRRSGGFVNGVLRTFIRNDKKIPQPNFKTFAENASVIYSLPQPLCAMFEDWYGAAAAEKIFAAFEKREKICVHVNTLRLEAKKAAEMLGGRVSDICGDTVVCTGFAGIADGIERGDWFVQDEASALCAAALGAAPGDTVADCCAAPGGKSFAAAMAMENKGTVYALDIHKNKLSLIEKGAKKLGIDIICARECDARRPDKSLVGKCRKVLCDAPCSGLGIIGKKPDIRYKSPDDFSRLPEIQYEVLCGASEYTAPGGTLVYSTCTLNPAENGEVCKRFLETHKDFSLQNFTVGGREYGAMTTLLPHIDGTDGFFICRMVRKA